MIWVYLKLLHLRLFVSCVLFNLVIQALIILIRLLAYQKAIFCFIVDRRGFLVFEFWRKRGVLKNCSEIGGQLKGGGVLLERGGLQIASSFFFQKTFHYYCCNQQIYSFMWFNFYQKMIYNEISFPLTLIFKYIL